MSKKFEFCTTHNEGDNVVWVNQGGKKVFTRKLNTIGYDMAKDLRKSPPYLQIIPCPYCGVDNINDSHQVHHHINPLLGTKS